MKAPIKEPLNVDLEVVHRELTPEERASLKAFLRTAKSKTPRKRTSASRVKARRRTKA
jgi:hypothetical protein